MNEPALVLWALAPIPAVVAVFFTIFAVLLRADRQHAETGDAGDVEA